ncbi:MAG: hypothetical protein JRJ17_08530 [Deltaproteobacteria bacterium]|nr:hypothetical protein [Deltaproteobacteria bacterium]
MGKDDGFRVVFSDDKTFGVEFSDEFIDSSLEEQMEVLKALLREKHLTPFSAEDVGRTDAENEIMVILLETFLAKLRRGERIERGTDIGIDFADLETPFNIWD